MSRPGTGIGVLGVLAVLAAPAAAQQDGRRIYDEQLRVRLDQQAPDAREMGLDAGGWFNFAFFNYKDGVADVERTLRQYELRLWGRMNLQGVHKAYVRGFLGWNDWNFGTNPDLPNAGGDEFRHSRLERAWYQFDLGRLQELDSGKTPELGLKTRVGRDYMEFGTGLVMAMPVDMVRIDLTTKDWELMAMLGKTIENSRNIDDSSLVYDHQRRCMWGVQFRYTALDQHRPFVYFLNNHDRTSPESPDPTQKYGYSTRYVGMGSEGKLLLPNLRYLTEIAGEFGETYSNGCIAGKDRVCAMIYDAALEYYFQTDMHPKLTAEYLYASGDRYLATSATSTVGGNLMGTRDNAFNAFGFRDTGLAAAPKMSNLNLYSLGGGFFPLEKMELFRKMEIGTKVFFYQKPSTGPISDTSATKDHRWVGWEWDVYCDWRITSDVIWTIRYGNFFPGSAYPDRDCRGFLYTAVTFSF
jgi:hypothetical protein